MIWLLDLEDDTDNPDEIDQLKTSLLNYLNSEAFNPSVVLSAKQIKQIIK